MPSTSSTLEIGNRLAEFIRNGENMEAINTLYASDIVSVEAEPMPGMEQTARGIEAVSGKNQWWYENNELHSCDIQGPFPHGDRFAIVFKIEATPKVGPMAGQKMNMEEVGLYTVADGKIAREEFFYTGG